MRSDFTILGVVLLLVSLTGWLALAVSPALGCAMIIVSPVLFVLGLIFLIVGLATESTPSAGYAMPYGATPAYAAPGGYGAPGYAPAAPAVPPAFPCGVCGRTLTWVPEYARWYCHSCMAYR